MSIRQETVYKQRAQVGDTSGRRFTTPLRKVFKRFNANRKKPTFGVASLVHSTKVLMDSSNIPVGSGSALGPGVTIVKKYVSGYCLR
jgi:hypothetical protein